MKIHQIRHVSLLASNIGTSLHASIADRQADVYGFVASENARGNKVTRNDIQAFLNLQRLRTGKIIIKMVEDGTLREHLSCRKQAPYEYTIGKLPVFSHRKR